GAAPGEQRVEAGARAFREHQRRAKQAMHVQPGAERGRRQPLVARHVLKRKQAGEPLALPDQHDAHVLRGAERAQRGQQHPGFVERIRLERIARERIPRRLDRFELGQVACDADAHGRLVERSHTARIMSRMWSGRIIAAAVGALAAGCASLPPPEERLDAQVTAILEQRGVGAQALLVIDNLMRNGPPAPRAAPALVQELFARPLDALDTAAIFRRVVPASLAGFTPASPLPFADLLQTYAEELASAQRLLQDATRPFDEELLLRQLQQGLPAPDALLALADALDPEKLRQANDLFIDATVRFARRLSGAESIPEGKVFDLGFGRIVIGTRGSDVHEVAPARGGKVSIIIDPGGDDEYRGSDLALHGFSA